MILNPQLSHNFASSAVSVNCTTNFIQVMNSTNMVINTIELLLAASAYSSVLMKLKRAEIKNGSFKVIHLYAVKFQMTRSPFLHFLSISLSFRATSAVTTHTVFKVPSAIHHDCLEQGKLDVHVIPSSRTLKSAFCHQS